MFFIIPLFIFVDLSSTAAPPWDSRLTQSHDLTQMSGTAEGKRKENHFIWHHKQTGINSHSNSISRSPTEGGWLSSPHVNVSRHLFQEATEDSKSVSNWPVISCYSTPQSAKLKNDTILDPVEKGRKTEAASSYRLFGIELINHSTSSPVEKAPAQPVSVSSGTTEEHVLSTLSATDSDKKSDISKEKKPEQLRVPPKDVQSRQSCSSSTRSCTKVSYLRYLIEVHHFW